MRLISLFAPLLVLLISCTHNNKCSSVENLRTQLKSLSGNAILFGHQDDLAYGIGWNGIPNASDVKRTTGSYPVIFGWEIGNIGEYANLDGVPFDSIRNYIKQAAKIGGINTISWHARYPKTNNDAWNLNEIDIASLLPKGQNHHLFVEKLELVAAFLESLKDENNQPIPIIFRPWHEMIGGWFWWGTKTCSDKEYIQLFRFTINYLKEVKQLNNLLIAYTPDGNADTREKLLQRYPGDDVVDIIGLDEYSDFSNNRLDKVVQKISLIVDLANEKNKIAALTETGCDRVEVDNWYTTSLLQVLKATEKTRSLAYVMVWRNSDSTHFYVPYPEHAQAQDFRNFTNDKLIYLLDEYKQLKR